MNHLLLAVSQLLSNAIRFCPQGGVVTMEASYRDGMVRVAVANTGKPFPEKFLPGEIRFERQEELLSLGLPLACRAARQLGGTIAYAVEGIAACKPAERQRKSGGKRRYARAQPAPGPVCVLTFPLVEADSGARVSDERMQRLYGDLLNPFGLLQLMMADAVDPVIPRDLTL